LESVRLVDKLGAGGMGEVWQAVDTTLDRTVAIKVLPELFAADPERLARFEREARLLASVNHANIATIHGLHEAGGVRFLAMELVPGEDLAARLARGPLAVDVALGFARQTANALAAAHANGVIHRDLKPANIRITPRGEVKVLDFGLAKALEPLATKGSEPSGAPTVTSAETAAGLILGTAAYMSPEQARGQAADQRADVWAFGCVLYEMLTGRQPFSGATISDLLAAVLRAEPDWAALPPETPPSIRRLLRRCLEKDPERRLHDIADARIEIDDAGREPLEVSHAAGPRPSRVPWGLFGAATLVALAVFAYAWTRGGSSAPGERQYLAVVVPHDLELMVRASGDQGVAISPDGKRLAFTARREDTVHLYLRSLDSPTAVEVAESGGAGNPFFSPDGQWVAFSAGGKLEKVGVAGGTPAVLGDAPTARGGSWSPDGTMLIIAPTFNSGLVSIPADGGEPRTITVPDRAAGERTHRWPDILPGGKAVVFTIGTQTHSANFEDATIAALDVTSPDAKIIPLIKGAGIARYSPSGHLVYARSGQLFAVPFDADRLEVTGPATPVLEGVASDLSSGAADFAIAGNGTLIYRPAAARGTEREYVWVTRDGRAETITHGGQFILPPSISPDGARVALNVGQGYGEGDLYVYDFARETMTRLTFDGSRMGAVWTTDGRQIIHGTSWGGREGLYSLPAGGGGTERLLLKDGGQYAVIPEAVVPSSGQVIFGRSGGLGGYSVLTFTPGDDAPKPLLVGPSVEGGTTLSPDGKWMAYASDVSGRYEIYVQPFPGPGGKWQISKDGGKGPRWSRDGREIFYTHGDRMMVVPVEINGGFAASDPRELFRFGFARRSNPVRDYDVSPDGKRFIMSRRPDDESIPREIDVITNFAATLGR